jgi:hypothetical protein
MQSKKQLPSEEYRRLCSLLYHLPGQVRSFLHDESRKAIVRSVFEEVVYLFARNRVEKGENIGAPRPRDALSLLTEFLPTQELRELLDSVLSAAIRQQAIALSSSPSSRMKGQRGDTTLPRTNTRRGACVFLFFFSSICWFSHHTLQPTFGIHCMGLIAWGSPYGVHRMGLIAWVYLSFS